MTDKPIAQWAIVEARRRCGLAPHKAPAIGAIRELAIMIERHEQPPVAPELLAAREWYANDNFIGALDAANVRAGEVDQVGAIQAFLAGVAWARENGQ